MAQYTDKSGIQYLFQKMMGYVDQAVSSQGGGGGGIEIMAEAEYTPALSDLNNMLDEIDESEDESE